MKEKGAVIRALRTAFPHTLPILAGFTVLGMSYGVYARASGFSFWVPVCMAVVIFGGSLEFVAVSMLLGAFMFFVSLLDQCYWICGTAIGALLGGVIPFSTEGLDFAMTALFVVIFLDRWLQEKKHWTALIGVLGAAGCLLVFGAEDFMIPTMACILVLLTAFRRPIERGMEP